MTSNGDYPPLKKTFLLACITGLLIVAAPYASASCRQSTATRQPLFGDLHIHTRYSFDSYLSGQRNGPEDAYRYAKGQSIMLPGADNTQKIRAQIDRPLDFAAVTDHAEFLGQIGACSDPQWGLGYWWPHCALTRASNIWLQLIAATGWTTLGGQNDDEPEVSGACWFSDCDTAERSIWSEIQAAAAAHNDTSEDCSFTTFVAYEYTDAAQQKNMHRNVIFRNEAVTDLPISNYDTEQTFTGLWAQLKAQCLEADNDCDVLAIPHNSNLSGGRMFRDPESESELRNRRLLEPLVEIVQHKGASECRYDRLRGAGVDTIDESCDFEQIAADNLHMLGSVNGKMRSERGEVVNIENYARRNMLRNTLKDGLKLSATFGENPFQFGFIGSTDTHSATAGAAQEFDYVGHLGRRDSEYRNVQDHFFSNPGGLAVVWAEENTRDAIFDAMQRRETYATSGTRPLVRFFAGEFNTDICSSPNLASEAYAHGVPMGSVITQASDQLRFLVAAQQDNGTAQHPGNPIERLQIVKGWVDELGVTQEHVFDVAGEKVNGSGVDPNSCAPTAAGASQLCRVWQDPSFDPTQKAFYYVRVLETPSCRWSTLQCQAAGVNPFSESCATQAQSANVFAQRELGASGPVYDKCCISAAESPFYSPVIQERAWTSPIWIE